MLRKSLYTNKNWTVNSNGTNSVSVASNTSIDFTALNQYTWMGRCKLQRRASMGSTGTVDGVFVQKSTNATKGFYLSIDADKINFQERTTNTKWSASNFVPYSYFNQWLDWACTYDGTAQDIHFYINGYEIESSIGAFSWANVTNDTTDVLRFGQTGAGTENPQGQICDCGQWNRILTLDEIRQFSLGKIPVTPAVFMPLNEGSGTTVTDTSSNGNTCTVSNNNMWTTESPQPTRTNAVGKNPTNALDFNQAASSRVAIADTGVLNNLTALTVECWVKFSAVGGLAANAWRIFDKLSAGTTGYKAQGSANTTTVGLTIGNSTTTANVNINLPFGKWCHVAVSWDGSKIYGFLNGILQNSGGTTLSGGNTGDDGNSLFISNSSLLARAFPGLIQEFRISNIARYTNSFVPQTTPFTSDSNTVGLWHLNDGSGTAPVDSGPNGLTGAFGGTNPVWATNGGYLTNPGSTRNSITVPRLRAINSYALDFTGTDSTSKVITPNNSTKDSLTALTMEAWVKPNTVADIYGGGAQRILDNYSNANKGYIIAINSTGKLQSKVSNGSTETDLSGSTTISTTGWSHVATVWDSSVVRSYVNGVWVGSGTLSGGNTGLSGTSMIIGNSPANTRGFNGAIQEVRVSNIARYTGSAFAVPFDPFQPDGNTVALYHMNEGIKQTLHDYSINLLTGTATGTTYPLWVSGYLN